MSWKLLYVKSFKSNCEEVAINSVCDKENLKNRGAATSSAREARNRIPDFPLTCLL
jgi:hypothetical protein